MPLNVFKSGVNRRDQNDKQEDRGNGTRLKKVGKATEEEKTSHQNRTVLAKREETQEHISKKSRWGEQFHREGPLKRDGAQGYYRRFNSAKEKKAQSGKEPGQKGKTEGGKGQAGETQTLNKREPHRKGEECRTVSKTNGGGNGPSQAPHDIDSNGEGHHTLPT